MARAAYALCLLAMLGLLIWMNIGPLAQIQAEAGGLLPFDLRPGGYDEGEARAFLAALSPAGREIYLGPQRVLDLIYPPLLALVVIWTFLALLPRGWALAVSLVPLAGAAADLTENARVAGLLQSAAPSATDIAAASQASLAKTGLVSLSLAIMGLTLLAAGAKWLGRAFRRSGEKGSA